ncbi:DUF2586 family protein [Paenibacillus melissococcoides]|uniref:DUF2586 family protein n=1 Tax=Paenibacillus melissococcoides TaxID=2912268 RepID=UPI0021C485DB|nr:DUF2586 family protein [Paenibacillus melissococcoides]
MLELLPEGIEDYVGLLDEEKYLTFRRYEGLDGFYVYECQDDGPGWIGLSVRRRCAHQEQDHT